MSELRRIRYFVAVAEELHFGRAALRLRIAQPPLTRHINALETELGFQLFERSTRAVQLTPAGNLFLERARNIIHAVDEARATARKIAHGMIGRVVIGYAGSIPMSSAFSGIIRNAGRSMPEVELIFREISTIDQPRQIADGTIDIGFGWNAIAAGKRVQSLVISRESLLAAVPVRSPYATRATVGFSELAAENFVAFPPGYGSALNAALENLCAQAGVVPQTGPNAAQITTLVSLVAAERGIAIVPGFMSALCHPGVAYVPIEMPIDVPTDALIDAPAANRPFLKLMVMWNEPFSSTCVERFIECARSFASNRESE